MARDAGERAIERFMPQAAELNAAAFAMSEGKHAVDVGKVAQRGGVESRGNRFANGGGAIDARDDGDVVASAGAAIGTFEAEEGAFKLRRGRGKGFDLRDSALKAFESDVVTMHPGAGGDRLAGEADRMAILKDDLSLGDRPEGDFVAGRNRFQGGNGTTGDFDRLLGGQRPNGDGDVVGGMKMQERGGLSRGGGVGHASSRLSPSPMRKAEIKGIRGSSGPLTATTGADGAKCA